MNNLLQRSRFRARGAAMLMVMAFAIIGGIAVTAWTYLLATRAIQASHMSDSVARHIAWGNNVAINQQYSLNYAFRDNVTQPELIATLSGGGGQVVASYTNLKAFSSTNNYSNPASVAAPFNNIRKQISADSSVYYTRTTATADASQTEHLLYYNFQKSYPRPLLGDLLMVYAKPSGAANTYITNNLKVNGRVVLYDSTADVTGVAANECLNLTKTGTNTTVDSTASATLLPQNFPSLPIFSAGSTGSNTGADLTGTLNMLDNSNFSVNSLSTDMTASSLGYYLLSTSSTTRPLVSGGTINSTTGEGYTNGVSASGSGSNADDIWVRSQSTPTYTPPVTSPYNYSWTSPLKSTTLLLQSSTLKHIQVVSGVDQLILQGQTNVADYNSAGTLQPLIIWVQQEVRDIRFVGENNRPIILGIGTGTGLTCYMSWSGSSTGSSGGPLRWRLHLINQYRNLYLDPPSGNNVTLTGSIRTNWSINSTNGSATTRFTLNTDSSPGTLVTLLPRDAWFEPLVVQ